jgi:hypothetical protein
MIRHADGRKEQGGVLMSHLPSNYSLADNSEKLVGNHRNKGDGHDPLRRQHRGHSAILIPNQGYPK